MKTVAALALWAVASASVLRLKHASGGTCKLENIGSKLRTDCDIETPTSFTPSAQSTGIAAELDDLKTSL